MLWMQVMGVYLITTAMYRGRVSMIGWEVNLFKRTDPEHILLEYLGE